MEHLSREHFIKLLDKRLTSICSLGYEDLPDVVMIDDYWHEDMSVASFKAAVQECAQTILDEAGYEGFNDQKIS